MGTERLAAVTVATETGHPDGDALASNLREVFRETDRRLIP